MEKLGISSLKELYTKPKEEDKDEAGGLSNDYFSQYIDQNYQYEAPPQKPPPRGGKSPNNTAAGRNRL